MKCSYACMCMYTRAFESLLMHGACVEAGDKCTKELSPSTMWVPEVKFSS